MRTIRPWMGGTFGLLTLLAIPAALSAQEGAAKPAGTEALLKAIPKDASGFVAIRNLKELDAKITGFAAAIGFPLGGQNSFFPAPLDWAKQSLGIQEGIEDNAGMAVVLLDCSKAQTPDEIPTRMVFLLPTSDAEALLKQLGAEKKEDIYELQFMGADAVAAKKGGFLAVAQTAEALKPALKEDEGIASSMAPDRVKSYTQQDLFLWAHFRGLSPALRKEITDAFEGVAQMGGAGNPMAGLSQIKNVINQWNKLMDDGQEVSCGLSIDARKGIGIQLFGSMKPDSPMGKMIADTKPAKGSLLVGLPNESTILAVGSVKSPGADDNIKQTLDALMGDDMLGKMIEESKREELKTSLTNILISVNAMSVSLSGLPAEGGEGMIGLTFVGQVENSLKWQEEARKAFATLKGVLLDAIKKEAAGQAGGDKKLSDDQMKALEDAVVLKENVEKIGNASVDHFILDLSKAPEISEDQLAEIKGVVGKEGILIRIAAIGEKHVAITMGGGAKRFELIAGHVGKGETPLIENKLNKPVADRLPADQRVAEGYLHIENGVRMAVDIMNQLNQPVPIPKEMIRETAPIGFATIKVPPSGMEATVLVPMELIQTVKQTVQALMPMFMGGGMDGMDGDDQPPPDGPSGELN